MAPPIKFICIYVGRIGVRAIQDNPTTARITFFDHTICPLQRLVELLEDQHRRWNDWTKSPQFSRGLYTHYKDFLFLRWDDHYLYQSIYSIYTPNLGGYTEVKGSMAFATPKFGGE